MSTRAGITERAVQAAILLLPALVLFWLVPFASDTTIGNDYRLFSIHQQMELAYSRERGSFPLYVPGFAAGRSQAALTLGQALHPLSHVAANTPGYWDGHALALNTLFRLVSLGLTQLFLFVFLRRLRLNILPAFIISFVTVYNMRMLDLFRYGASLENYTGYLLLCTSMGFLFLERGRISAAAAVIISTYLLVCGGHPQMMYLGLLGAAAVALAMPFVLPSIDPSLGAGLTWRGRFSFWGIALACVGAGIILSAAYVLPFYFEFVADNSLRVDRDYAWSLAYQDTIGGILNSLFLPLAADVHGAFGSSPIILVALLAPLLLLIGVRVPAPVLALVLVSVAIILCTSGELTPVHQWFWEHAPLAQTFRTPGRMSMMLPFILLMILAWLFAPADRLRPFRWKDLPCSRLALPALGAAIAYAAYHRYWVESLPPGRYTPATIIGEKMRDEDLLHRFNEVFPLWYWLGLAALALALLYSIRIAWKPRLWKGTLGALLALVVVAQVTGQFRFGTWQTEATPSKTLERMNEEKKQRLSFRGLPGFGMEYPAVTAHLEQSALEPMLARFYRKAVAAKDADDAYEKILTRRRGDNIVVEGIDVDLRGAAGGAEDRIVMTYSSFNRLVFELEANADGWFAMSQPHDGRWRAWLDGRRAPLHRANGIENALFVERGRRLVEFYYTSAAATAGALAATALAIALGVFFSFVALGPRMRWVAAAAAAAIFALHFLGWRHSLYSGDNLKTAYDWSSAQLPAPENLAYARPTSMSSVRSSQMPYRFHGGIAVDGDRAGRAFSTNPRRRRHWWQVDLGGVRSIGEIHIYDRSSGPRHLPLRVFLSEDGKRFETASKVEERDPGPFWRIDLGGAKGRYLRLRSGGRSAMAWREVEVFEFANPVRDEPGEPTRGP